MILYSKSLLYNKTDHLMGYMSIYTCTYHFDKTMISLSNVVLHNSLYNTSRVISSGKQDHEINIVYSKTGV